MGLITFALIAAGGFGYAAEGPAKLDALLSYPFVSDLTAAPRGGAIAWARNVRGARNIWVARGPAFEPRSLTRATQDDGQELTELSFSPDGTRLVWVRGGDHDANWPADGGLAPNPASDPAEPAVTIWTAALDGGAPAEVTKGDEPTISPRGVLAFVKDHQVWTAPLDGKGKPERLFFDCGQEGSLAWSPDGTRLAFVSARGDHAFIGVYAGKDRAIVYLAPSTGKDDEPRWSPDGARIAFTRRHGDGGSPEPLLTRVPKPWSIWVADATSGAGRAVWRSPDTLDGSYPDTEGEANLNWMAGERLAFTADLDGWPHLYSVPVAGGAPTLLTPGAFMVEHMARSPDGRFIVYDANTGATPDDTERRHVFRTPVDRAAPTPLTAGTGLEWAPVAAADDRAAFIAAGPQAPAAVSIAIDGAGPPRRLETAPVDYPAGDLIIPKAVTFKSPDGLTIHAQLFQPPGGGVRPGVVFAHGGPPRQMLLGWHYMDYYSNAYALNQYLAARGFVVLSVNYRLGIGYGRAFNQPEHAGPAGAAEYQDVLAGGRYLAALPGVDRGRIGMWGGSYGGYLTGLALARNSDLFKAGVDWHGVHDWTWYLAHDQPDISRRFEQGDREKAATVAFAASPDADVATWRSPVLLIQGDDDRNVSFTQTIDLARRLEAQHVRYEELVIPNEIHGFLRHAAWLTADAATARFLERELGAPEVGR